MNIYLSVSDDIASLPGVVKKRIDSIVSRGYRIIFKGDCKSSKLIESYLSSKEYSNALVYCPEGIGIYNNGIFSIDSVDYKPPEMIDMELLEAADYGFVVFSLLGYNTLNAMADMVSLGKRVLVYSVNMQEFIVVSSYTDIISMLSSIIRRLSISNANEFWRDYNGNKGFEDYLV